jgi:hypothetical protein
MQSCAGMIEEGAREALSLCVEGHNGGTEVGLERFRACVDTANVLLRGHIGAEMFDGGFTSQAARPVWR